MASLVMGLGIFGIYTAFEKMLKFDASLLGSHSTKEIIFIVVALMFSIILGMAIYAVMLFILKSFSYDEAKAFPIIGKFVRKYAGKKERWWYSLLYFLKAGDYVRTMEFKMERPGVIEIGENVHITEGILPSSFYYIIVFFIKIIIKPSIKQY